MPYRLGGKFSQSSLLRLLLTAASSYLVLCKVVRDSDTLVTSTPVSTAGRAVGLGKHQLHDRHPINRKLSQLPANHLSSSSQIALLFTDRIALTGNIITLRIQKCPSRRELERETRESQPRGQNMSKKLCDHSTDPNGCGCTKQMDAPKSLCDECAAGTCKG